MGHLGSILARVKLKGIGGGAHKRWRLRFNWIQRRERWNILSIVHVEPTAQIESLVWNVIWIIPSSNLTRDDGRMRVRLKVLPDKPRAAAWPSSARIVRRAVKSVNERDPHHMLLIFCPQEMHSCETAGDKPEEGVGDGRSVWRESSGLHAAYKA